MRAEQILIADWIAEGSRVLDLGCGDGALLAELHASKHVTGYGIEIDPDNIVACIERGVNVIHSNLDEGLSDFDEDSFDYVIMTQTVQAMRFPHLLIDEILRIGRQGIVTFPNMGHWKCRAQFMLGRMPVTRHLPNTWYDTPNIHMCTVKDFDELCKAEHIEILERAAVDSQHRAVIGMRLLPNLLAEIAIYRIKRKA
ncbi:MAG: methionine biosynthesis protein MetW [Gammaproteobacteria bacterium]|nr:methionine biosynthesis protein MetW [Gammaproteobacteria bacterium]MCZ6894090.1 methionine biosynthesis protein MetW [Gammaproteobacteria bacterium]